jgi:hypothetical protein
MRSRFMVGIVCSPLTLAPAMAQNVCLTLSEGLRCANDSASPRIGDVIQSVGQTPVPPGAVRSVTMNCPGSESVFLHGAATCE